MCAHSRPLGSAQPNRSPCLAVVLCGLGHCCAGPCGLLSPALGDVWFTWHRNGLATTLVVLESNDSSMLSPLVHAVNNCAHKDRIRVRTRGIDDRGRALAAITFPLQRGHFTIGDPNGRPRSRVADSVVSSVHRATRRRLVELERAR